MGMYVGISEARSLMDEVQRLREGMDYARSNAAKDAAFLKDIEAIEQKLDMLVTGPKRQPGTAVAVADFPLGRLSGAFGGMLDLLQEADVAPTIQAVTAAADLQTALDNANEIWEAIKDKDVAPLNVKLAKANITPIQIGLHH